MKKRKIIILACLMILGWLVTQYLNKWYTDLCAWWFCNSSIYNTWLNNAISGGDSTVDPIRYGVQTITTWVTSTWGIMGILHTNIISNHMEALDSTLRVVQNIVNYALGMVWLIALIYMLVQWFIVLTAGTDDSKQKKWFKWIKNGLIAMAWIALSWIIVSFLLRVINTVAY